ncbi:MAG: PilT/PilU family type 4a pilus ATPase [Elusimicrobiota bacterium]|nr:PilT/PilU family type 4a pilus ATPase [Elusimicrobiota bacterium]
MQIVDLLRELVEKKGSDLHLRVGSPPIFRINGRLVRSSHPALSSRETERIGFSLLNEKQKQIFEENHECDLSYAIEGLARFRINIFHQRGTIHIAFRLVPFAVPDFERLNLPLVLKKISENERGLILVTGPAGCGKSTTLAAIVDYINSIRAVHIITIEDPIEFLHQDKKSVVTQRELGEDTLDYPAALKHIVRQDANVILVGEMRDLATMAAALTAAQLGSLVLSTVHTIDAVQTITRIIDLFPPHQQNQVRLQLADTLKAVISQRLLPRADGKGRIPAVEVLVATALVKKLIEENRIGETLGTMEKGDYYGMQSFNQALQKLYSKEMVKLEDALASASNPEELLLYIRGIDSGSGAKG